MSADALPPTQLVRPILFVHIPKTAGTSLLLGLQNLFGDNRVVRLTMDWQLQRKIADIVAGKVPNLACVSGHVPLCEFVGDLGKFLPFTVLRRPFDRLFSQFRFLRQHRPEVLAGMQLRPDFTFAEFLAAPAPEIFSQVHNGMARVLGGTAAMWEVGAPEYQHIEAYPAVLETGLRALEGMEFGLAEDMAATFRLLSQRLAVPIAFDSPTVNVTDQQVSAEEESVANIEEVLRLNPFDTALYDAAVAILAARARQARRPWNNRPDMVFAPALNHVAGVGDIPGRRGFHGVEENTIAWLRADGPASIHFRWPGEARRIALRCYCPDGAYPIEQIALDLNGTRIGQRAKWDQDGWFQLETDPLDTTWEQNFLTIAPPCYYPARQTTPGTGDDRLLSIALGSVVFWP